MYARVSYVYLMYIRDVSLMYTCVSYVIQVYIRDTKNARIYIGDMSLMYAQKVFLGVSYVYFKRQGCLL